MMDGASPEAAQTSRRRSKHKHQRHKDRIELIAALLIGVAAVMTAVATFQNGRVDGQISEQHTIALGLTLRANDAFNAADAQQAIERDWIFTWITEASNDTPAADYLEDAMPDEVFALAEEWLNADDDIADPFSSQAAEVYNAYAGLPSVGLVDTGADLDEEAACATFTAQVLDVQGNWFGLSTVFLAISLVVGGFAALLRSRVAENIALVTALTSLVIGATLLVIGTDQVGARNQVAPDFYANILGETVTADEAIAFADEVCPAHDA